MTFTRPSEVRRLLDGMGIVPSRALGQNFLIDGNIARIIVESAHLSGSDHVLEVGPGLGALTELIAGSCAGMVVIEKDDRLARHLSETFSGDPRIEVVAGDALLVGIERFLGRCDVFVSNLPYRSGSRILVELARSDHRPRRMVVTVQKEVAERLAAAPGTGDYGLLGVWVQANYVVSVEKIVSPSCFWPKPEVESAVVAMERKPQAMSGCWREEFYRLTKHVFEYRRKQLGGLARKKGSAVLPADWVERLQAAGIAPAARAGEVAVDHWVELARSFAGLGLPHSPQS